MFNNSVLYWLIWLVIVICGCANCQLLDVIHDNIYEASPLHECKHDLELPSDDFENDSEFRTCSANVAQSRTKVHPDQDKRIDAVILKYGYNLITYPNVTTKDGYILTVFRITGKPSSVPLRGKPAVLLLHGSGMSSDIWVLQNDEKKNLPFILADAGYDVWLANARGTDFSQGHVKLNAATDLKYWDFSFHEVGVQDFPAIIDLMLSETRNDKIFYIGHSSGGAAYAAALAEMPELNEKIHASFLLAPAIFVGHAYHPARLLSGLLEYGPRVQKLLNSMLRGQIEGSVPQLQEIFQPRYCAPTALKCGVCENVLFYLYGYDSPHINVTSLPNILSKSSNTQSVKSFIHMGQNFRSCEFRKYDYGLRANLRRYGKTQPPSYNLTNLLAPMYIFYGAGDNFVPPVDARTLKEALPPATVKGFYGVKWKYFNHIDFAISKDADILLYNDIVDTMNKYLLI